MPSPPPPPDDWPAFRGAHRLGVSTSANLPLTFGPTENILFKTPLPGPGASSPIIVGQRIFLTCHTGYAVPGQPQGEIESLKRHLLCLNRDDGKILWTRDVPAKLPESPTIRENHGYASATPAADSQRVYAFFGKSGVFAFDHNGNKIWQADVGSKISGWGSAASPVLYKNLVIVNASVESDAIIALDSHSGREIWRAPNIRESWNAPIFVTPPNGPTELVVAVVGKILGLDPDSGKQLWSCDTNIRWYMVPGLCTDGTNVYAIGGRSNDALAVRSGGRGDVTRSHLLWTIKKGANVPSPVLHDRHLYWINENQGIAYCADANTGKILYEQRIPNADMIYASPIIADDRLYYITRTGRIFILAAKPAYQLLASIDMRNNGAFNASPAVASNRLYIRSDRFLFCFGKN